MTYEVWGRIRARVMLGYFDADSKRHAEEMALAQAEQAGEPETLLCEDCRGVLWDLELHDADAEKD